MILHDFVCRKCNVVVQDKNTKVIHKCPDCGKDMAWDCRIAIHGNYRRPIISDSLAINPSQIPEHKKRFPNIEITPDGRPIFDNFTKHENYLQATGFVKHKQKIRKKATQIV